MYFKYDGGQYIPDPDGVLVGVEGTDENGNNFYGIAFMLNFSSLQYGQSIEWIYQVLVKPEGLPDYIFMRNETMPISNSNYVNKSTGDIVPPEEATTEGEDGAIIINDGYDRQLDFFVDTYFKGLYTTEAMYTYFVDEMFKQ